MRFTKASGLTVSFSSVAPTGPSAKGTAVTFTASATGGVGTVKYQFKVNGTVKQAWSTTPSYVDTTMLGGTNTVLVEVSTAATPTVAEASASTTYDIIFPAATGVSFTAIAPASPQVYGTVVTFTAAGTGSDPGATYQYRFRLDGGTPTAWGPTATFTMPGTTAVGNHTLVVDVTTEAVPATVQATTSVPYTINAPPPATGATLLASKVSPNTPPLCYSSGQFFRHAAPKAYLYEFRARNPDGTFSVVQPWSSTNTWSLPGVLAKGLYAGRTLG